MMIKHSIRYQIHDYCVNSLVSYFRFSWVRYYSRVLFMISTTPIYMRLARAALNDVLAV